MLRRDFLRGAVALGFGALLPSEAFAAPAFRVIRRFRVPTVNANTRKLHISARPTGGFAALFESDGPNIYEPSYARLYDANLRPIGLNRELSINTFSGSTAGTIIANPDGTSQIFWFGWRKNDNAGDLWWMSRLSSTGTLLGAPVRIGQGWQGEHHLAVRLKNGNFMSAWRGQGSGRNNGKVVTPTGATVAQNLGRMSAGPIDALAALPNGGAVSASFGADLKVSFQILSSTAQPVGRPISMPSVYVSGGVTVASHPLGFVGVWKNADAQGKNPFLDGALFSTSGRLLARFQPQPLRPGLNEDVYSNFYPVVVCHGSNIIVACNSRYLSTDRTKMYYQVIGFRFNTAGRRVSDRVVLYNATRTTELYDLLNRPRALTVLKTGQFLLSLDTGVEYGQQDATAIQFAYA